jgi:uncharacterized protein YcbK (DUF882 family)
MEISIPNKRFPHILVANYFLDRIIQGTTNHEEHGETMNRRQFLGLALSAAALPALAKTKSNQPRILTLRHLHTDEKIRIAYRIGDQYQRDALQKLNRFLRDHRSGQSTAMDPKLFDLLYDLQRRAGNHDAEFEVFSAYRSPRTNALLRRTSRRVAKRSLHMKGQAIDVRLEGCALRKVRDTAISMGRGGVGFYPRSSFVHVDTGPVRTWGA